MGINFLATDFSVLYYLHEMETLTNPQYKPSHRHPLKKLQQT